MVSLSSYATLRSLGGAHQQEVSGEAEFKVVDIYIDSNMTRAPLMYRHITKCLLFCSLEPNIWDFSA